MSRFCVFVLGAAVVAAIATPAWAQGRGRGGLRQGNVAPIQLLKLDEVQADLKLTDDQKKNVAAEQETFMKSRREIFGAADKDSGERGPKMKELNDTTSKALASVLDEGQQKRLKEIVLQVNGAAELDNEELAAELKITPEQNKQLAEIRKANAKARRDALKVLADGGAGNRNEIIAKLQVEGDAKLLAVLTDEQRSQFEAKQGKKLELKLFGA